MRASSYLGLIILSIGIIIWMMPSAYSQPTDGHTYLLCHGPSRWNQKVSENSKVKPISNKGTRWARIKVERHGFAQETLHIYWALYKVSRGGEIVQRGWSDPTSAKVQWNDKDDGVWYVSDVKTLGFFSARGHLHGITSFHRPWDNQWVRFYNQMIPVIWGEINGTLPDQYEYRVEAYEMRCMTVDPFDG